MALSVEDSAAARGARAGIERLVDLVDRLPEPERDLFARIYRVSQATGTIDAPPEMAAWLAERYGPVEAFREQRIVKVLNRYTGEATHFNPLRGHRPIDSGAPVDLAAEVSATRGDAFCHPEEATSRDPFGRIYGRFCRTAGNLAKFDGLHGVVIFDRHDPLDFGIAEVADYLATAVRWCAAAHRQDPAARYPLITWNCHWKAGASIVHGHAQVTLARDFPVAQVEVLRQAAVRYQSDHQRDYFDDLAAVSRALGLSVREPGLEMAASLTPVKEREIVAWAPALDSRQHQALGRLITLYRDCLGVRSFNLAVALPPLGPAPEDWSGFPVVVRLVDRGDPTGRSCDVAAMELFGSNVVTSDPFEVAGRLRQALTGQTGAE